MKEIIHLPKTLYITIMSIFALSFFSILIWLGINWFKYQKELESIQKDEIEGIIIQSRDIQRGLYYLEINDAISNSKIGHDLPDSKFFIDNQIQVNDSVSKPANSKIMTFYKRKNGVYFKCCKYVVDKM